MFVDDDIYADVIDVTYHHMEQAATASLDVFFITLGSSDLTNRQNAVSFHNFQQTPVAWLNRLLGVDINTHCCVVQPPSE